jgi:hypothetical protein
LSASGAFGDLGGFVAAPFKGISTSFLLSLLSLSLSDEEPTDGEPSDEESEDISSSVEESQKS